MEYDKQRYYFFTQSYIASKTVNFLRQKYKIPVNISSVDWFKRLAKDHWSVILEIYREMKLPSDFKINFDFVWAIHDKIERKIMPEIPKLAKELNIDERLFRVFVIYNNVPKKLSGPQKIFRVYPWESLKEEGTYIKVDEKTTTREIIELLKEVKNFWLPLEIVSDKKAKIEEPNYKKLRRKDMSKADSAKGYVYLNIEKNIVAITKEKSGNKYLNEELYRNEIVKPAVAQVVDDYLNSRDYSEEKKDKQYDRMIKLFNSYYYDIIERYKLPTYRDWNRISRLMQS